MLKINYFLVSFISLISYSLLIGIVNPANGSDIKIIITFLLWIAFIFSLIQTVKITSNKFYNLPKTGKRLASLLIIWNIINILRSIYLDQGSFKTMFGNQYTSLSLLIPFVISFGIYQNNVIIFRKYCIRMIIFGVLLAIILIPILNINFKFIVPIYTVLFASSIFFIPTIFQEKIWYKIFIILSCILMLLYIAPDSRATMLKYSLLCLSPGSIYLYKKTNQKLFLSMAFFMLLIPLIYLYQGINSGTSIFELISREKESELTTDTRTFLYREVFEDLNENHNFIIGKGANSTYYSSYFDNTRGDSNLRLTVEVGLLAILLKGGLIAVMLNFAIFIYAIFLAFFRSNNNYVIAIGFFILIHVILLFIENLVAYSIYNFIVWFSVGVCLNNEFRNLNNKQIKLILHG